MTIQDVKTEIDKFGRNNITSDSVIEIINGNIELKNAKRFLRNQVSLMDCVFDFSRNFNDSVIESILPCLNSMIETSKTTCLLQR